MPLSVVVTGSERENTDERAALAKVFAAYLTKLRGVYVERVRRGQRADRLLRAVEVAKEPDDNAAELVAELVSTVFEIITDDACEATKKIKYVVVLEGDGLSPGDAPELTRVPIIMEPDDSAPPTRESELLGTIGMLRELVRDIAKEYLLLAKESPKLVAANAETARELGTALATATTGGREWDFKLAQLETDARIAVADLNGRIQRSDRMWQTFDHFFEEMIPYFDIAAAEFTSGAGGRPTEEEIDHLFGEADPDLAELCRVFLGARGAEAEALREALLKRWKDLANDRKAIVLGKFRTMDKRRIMAVGLWMKKQGLR